MPTSSSNILERQSTGLVDLPSELLISLIDFLDWPCLTSLRLTNSRFQEVIDKKTLLKQHDLCAKALLANEHVLLRQFEKEFWEAAEESFQGYHSSSYTSSSLDPDLLAYEDRLKCTHTSLPCYHCLRWLPSLTDEAKFATESAFSRGRSTRTFNLAGKHATERICIPCGMRTKLYPKGTRVKHSVICARCETLAGPLENWAWFWKDPKKTWQMSYYCRVCLDTPSVINQTLEQYRHEKKWRKYEDGMRNGKRYRLEKGARLRQERGILLVKTQGSLAAADVDGIDAKAGKRYCPVMQEKRLCAVHVKKCQMHARNYTLCHAVKTGRNE